jgi:hypothetical protein
LFHREFNPAENDSPGFYFPEGLEWLLNRRKNTVRFQENKMSHIVKSCTKCGAPVFNNKHCSRCGQRVQMPMDKQWKYLAFAVLMVFPFALLLISVQKQTNEVRAKERANERIRKTIFLFFGTLAKEDGKEELSFSDGEAGRREVEKMYALIGAPMPRRPKKLVTLLTRAEIEASIGPASTGDTFQARWPGAKATFGKDGRLLQVESGFYVPKSTYTNGASLTETVGRALDDYKLETVGQLP